MECSGWRIRVLAGLGAALASAAFILPATAGGAGAPGVLTLGLMLAALACPWPPGRVAHDGQRHVG